MLVYAEKNDLVLGNWLRDFPDDADALIRDASSLVREATRLDRYNTLPNGLPEDDDYREAMRDAACAQVAMWVKAGIDPGAGSVGRTVGVESQSADGGTVKYTGHASAAEVDAAVNTLCAAGWRILRNAGMCSTRPTTW